MVRVSVFEKNALSKTEMKKINGGMLDCHVWMLNDYGCVISTDSFSQSEAQSRAANLVSQLGAGYGWCCGSDC